MTHFEMVCAFLVGSAASARIARLIGFDSYPPVVWLRIKWDNATHNSDWNKLIHCGYCSTPYIAAADGGWGWVTHFQLAWWIVNIWLAASYAAAYIVSYDGDD